MAALIKAGLTLAKNLIKKMAKEYLKSQAQQKSGGIIKWAVIIAIAIGITVPLMGFALFGNLICTISNCDGDTGKKEDVISISMMKDVATRMESLRTQINAEAKSPGENYGYYTMKLGDNENENTKAENPKQEISENAEKAAETSGSFPQADPAQWVTGKTTNVNEGLLRRLAAVGQAYGKKVIIYSGWRPYSQQLELYEGYKAGKPGYNLAAQPLYDSHVLGLAVDVTGWLQQVPSSALEPYGLAKEIPGENWHIQGKGFINIERSQRINYQYDGFGVPQELVDQMFSGQSGDIPKVNPSLSSGTSSSSSGESEAYIHLLALSQVDELDMTYLGEEHLEKQEEEGTNLGKTWKLAKALKEEVLNGNYEEFDYKKRAKEENWGIRQYFKLARWEIQKCFLIGDDSQKGLFEAIFGGPKPCSHIKSLTKEDIVPEKLQGVINKTSKKTICDETKDGKCVKDHVETTVTYTGVQDLLYMYKDISLFKKKEDFPETMKEILGTLYDRTAGPAVTSGSASTTPTYIVPLEKGTYQVDKKYGDKLDEGVAKGIYFKVDRLTPLYASIGGEVLGTYKDETGKNTIVIHNKALGYIEYKGVAELIVKDGTVQQGQLIGSINKDTPLEFRTCEKISDNKQKPTCVDSTDPTSGKVKLTLEPGIDDKISKQRETDYASWKKKSEPVFMPGFSSLSNLGKLSAKYESSGDPGICVMDTAQGGLQCGSYQIANAPGTLGEFINYLKDSYPQYYTKLVGVQRTLHPFGDVWREVYNSDKVGFEEAQHNYIGTSHYLDIANKIKKKYGFDPTTHSIAVQDMVWSYSVQHRNNTLKAWDSAIGTNWKGMTDKEILERMYDERMRRWPAYTNRYVNEKKQALEMLAASGYE